MRILSATIAMTVGGLVACSADAPPAPGTEGAICPNDNNCLRPLRCIEGTCQMVEGVDTGPVPDAGPDLDGGVGPDAGPTEYTQTITGGYLQETPDGQTLGLTLTGTAAMVREDTGYTDVRVDVGGLSPGTEYPAHVHAKACADEGGGGHYLIDDTITEVVPENEIWPTVTVGPDGYGYGRARVAHYARPEAQSVVIHEPVEGRRIACFDLLPNADVVASGTFTPFPTAAVTITGSAELRRYSGGTQANVRLDGPLPPGTVFPIHVHAKACDDEDGGPHYKFDTTVEEALEENEVWPDATVNAAGDEATGAASAPTHIARFDAVSMVVHDPDTGARLACADLSF